MAIELQVTIAVINTEPEQVGGGGVIVRSMKGTSLIVDERSSTADVFALAEARMIVTADECLEDCRGQLQLLERSNR